jgi:hypothetical protein
MLTDDPKENGVSAPRPPQPWEVSAYDPAILSLRWQSEDLERQREALDIAKIKALEIARHLPAHTPPSEVEKQARLAWIANGCNPQDWPATWAWIRDTFLSRRTARE